jgi:hypothetical protein
MVTDYWAEIMQDVCYLIAADGWKAETYRVIETDKKGKEKDKGWTCEARNGYARAHRLVRLVRASLAAIFLSAWVPSAKMRVRMATPTLADAILDWSARYVQAYPCGRFGGVQASSIEWSPQARRAFWSLPNSNSA